MSDAHTPNETTSSGESMRVTKAIARFSTMSSSRDSGASEEEKWVDNFGAAADTSMLPTGRTVASVCAEHGGSAILKEALRGLTRKEQKDEHATDA